MILAASFILMTVLVAIDQVLKYIVVENLDIGEIISLINIGGRRVLELTHIRNSGAAWSIMQGKTWFLIGLPIVVLVVGIVFMVVKRKTLTKLEMIMISMIVAGGIGNLIDRIRFKEVVDFISFKLIDFPVFNFADICVVLGELLLIVYVFFGEFIAKKNKDKEKEQPKDNSDEQA